MMPVGLLASWSKIIYDFADHEISSFIQIGITASAITFHEYEWEVSIDNNSV